VNQFASFDKNIYSRRYLLLRTEVDGKVSK